MKTKLNFISQAVTWSVFFACFFAVVACDDRRRSDYEGTPDAVPQVTLVTPAPGTVDLPINSKVFTATFTKAMDTDTLTTGTFTIACPAGMNLAGTITYLTASKLVSLTLPSSSSLPPSTNCVGTITTGAQDNSGMPLAADYIWRFATANAADTTAPTVNSTTNPDGATGVSVNSKGGATFSESMDPLSITTASFLLAQGTTPVNGTVTYSGVTAIFTPSAVLAYNTAYTATISTAAKDLAGNPLASNHVWTWTTGTELDTIAPTVASTSQADGAIGVAINIKPDVSFSEAMDPLSITTGSFLLKQGTTPVVGTVSSSGAGAVFTPNASLTYNTAYTGTISTAVTDLAGNRLASNYVWTWTTESELVVPPPVVSPVDLKTAAIFGTFGGSAGMTNSGILTTVTGSIGTSATGASSITGFHDSAGDIYTETPLNSGSVSGKIYTCTSSTVGPTSTGPNATACAYATQGSLDARAAYLALVAKPPGANPGSNLGGLTLAPGTYTAPSGSFEIRGGDLTLDGQGDVNAVWIFQMASTLTVGGPGAAFPQSVILAGGAQAKNVYWQVGTAATINAAGGGTMVGTIIAQSGAEISTADNTNVVTIIGRVLSLGASVTMVNTALSIP